MLNSFERMKEKLNSKLNDAITFLEKESFRILKEKITNIKLKAQSFLEFPSNETGLEGINLTPVMGEKRNNEKDNEDKEGNGEEDNDNDGPKPEVVYLLDGNDAENKGTKNDGETNKKEIVENIVDDVLGSIFSSLNSQEDKIWNDIEMKIILDNIDIVK
uniref:Uncharacterized protein n=1 Tax=Lactuca sativa TaxID=4236 RepID=A0A9R1W2T8_LACSA|nr:hypothetical protein LSAT_V11C300114870 [Lactuca sativa]